MRKKRARLGMGVSICCGRIYQRYAYRETCLPKPTHRCHHCRSSHQSRRDQQPRRPWQLPTETIIFSCSCNSTVVKRHKSSVSPPSLLAQPGSGMFPAPRIANVALPPTAHGFTILTNFATSSTLVGWKMAAWSSLSCCAR